MRFESRKLSHTATRLLRHELLKALEAEGPNPIGQAAILARPLLELAVWNLLTSRSGIDHAFESECDRATTLVVSPSG
jgi:hypothetical protein